MNDSGTKRGHSFWCNRSTKLAVVVLAAFVVAGCVAIHFRYHLWWKFKLEPIVGKLQPVPVSPMREVTPSHGWYRCRIGPMSIRLPQNLVDRGERNANAVSISFEDDDLVVGTSIPRSGNLHVAAAALKQTNAQFPQKHWKSYRQLMADEFLADSDEFKWSMSPEEARQFMLWMTNVRLTRSRKVVSVETYFGETSEGLLYFENDGRARYSWGTLDGDVTTLIGIKGKRGSLKPELVREICQSVKLLDPVPRSRTREEVRQIFDSIEFEREE